MRKYHKEYRNWHRIRYPLPLAFWHDMIITPCTFTLPPFIHLVLGQFSPHNYPLDNCPLENCSWTILPTIITPLEIPRIFALQTTPPPPPWGQFLHTNNQMKYWDFLTFQWNFLQPKVLTLLIYLQQTLTSFQRNEGLIS